MQGNERDLYMESKRGTKDQFVFKMWQRLPFPVTGSQPLANRLPSSTPCDICCPESYFVYMHY